MRVPRSAESLESFVALGGVQLKRWKRDIAAGVEERGKADGQKASRAETFEDKRIRGASKREEAVYDVTQSRESDPDQPTLLALVVNIGGASLDSVEI